MSRATRSEKQRKFFDSCCPKKAYRGRKFAASVAASVRRERHENVEAYHCDACGKWHIGHVPGGPRKTSGPRLIG